MKNLLSCSNVVVARISGAEHILLLIDYDGTLTPIVKKPELANLSPQVKGCLQELAENPQLTLGIISGRSLEDLQERMGINGIIYVGNHGLEIEGPGITYVNPVAKKTESFLHSLCQDIGRELAGIKGATIEDKGLTLSLHYRLVDETQLEELDKIFYHLINSPLASGKVKITPSKKAYDIRPAVDWNKGKAIEFLARRLNGKLSERGKLLVIFLGDDMSDYDGFRVVDKSEGISIFIGEESAELKTQYFLRSPSEVYQFLNMLRKTLKLGDS